MAPTFRDYSLPPGLAPPATATATRRGVSYRAARWTPVALGELAAALNGAGAAALAAVSVAERLAAWGDTVAAFRRPDSPARRALADPLAALTRLSPAGLTAGLEAVLGGVAAGPAAALADELPASFPQTGDRSLALLIAAGNLPALALQPLLPALLAGRPTLVKSPSAEPLLAPAFVAELVRREPRLAPALAAISWPGGDPDLEAPLLAAAGRVVAYGEAETLADLERRPSLPDRPGPEAPGRLIGYGPKTSLAIVDAAAATSDLARVAAGLARDIALFDQRGCLSVAAVYCPAGTEEELAQALAAALAEEAVRLPPGVAEIGEAAAVQQLRLAVQMEGRAVHLLDPPAAGSVLIEQRLAAAGGGEQPTAFEPTPGLRTVRIYPVADLAALPALLAPWRGRLQGAALAGDDARALAPALEESLGISRCAGPGRLQAPDALWHNGGIHPLAALL